MSKEIPDSEKFKIEILDENEKAALLLVEIVTSFSPADLVALAQVVLDFIARTPRLKDKALSEVVKFNLSDFKPPSIANINRQFDDAVLEKYLKEFAFIYTVRSNNGVADFFVRILTQLQSGKNGKAEQLMVSDVANAQRIHAGKYPQK